MRDNWDVPAFPLFCRPRHILPLAPLKEMKIHSFNPLEVAAGRLTGSFPSMGPGGKGRWGTLPF